MFMVKPTIRLLVAVLWADFVDWLLGRPYRADFASHAQRDRHHDGPPYYCAGASCPGFPYRASELAHPPSCARTVERKELC